MANNKSSNSVKLLDEVISGVVYTKPVYLGEFSRVSFHILWDGVTAAEMELQTTNDATFSGGAMAARWFPEATTLSGMDGAVSDGSVMHHVSNLNCTYARLKFNTTVAGQVTVYTTTK